MKNNKQSKITFIPAKYMTKPYLASAGIVAFALLAGGTVYASDGSKPGDVLYSIDITTEKARSTLAFSPERKAVLALNLAAERVSEVQAIVTEPVLDASGLGTALDGLAAQRALVADLVAKEAELKQQAKTYEDTLDKREADLDATFTEAKRRINAREKELKIQLKQAQAAVNTTETNRIQAELAALEDQEKALQAEEEAAEETLDAEEERLEEELEAKEKAVEAEEEAREAEVERLEDEAEAAREKAEEASDADKEALEQAAEQAEEAEDKAREDNEKEAESEEVEKRETEKAEQPEESRR